jgi:hypothetical protein
VADRRGISKDTDCFSQTCLIGSSTGGVAVERAASGAVLANSIGVEHFGHAG